MQAMIGSIRWFPVFILAIHLAALDAIACAQQNYSPASSAYHNIVRLGANKPLTPEQRRTNYPLRPRVPGAPLVLMSIAGGGSRAAYYAACVMEQLSHQPSPAGHGSVLDDVRVISTISAGSLAAAWFVLHYDERYQPDFFDRFKKAMSANLQWRTYGHMAVFPPLALQLVATPITRTDLLANEMERLLGAGAVTFDDLRELEIRPHDPPPTLIINGTALNSGQRLVMTNLPPSRFPSQLAEIGPKVTLSPTDLGVLQRLVQPLTFEDIGSDIGSFRLAQAVAASAAYPVVLAPVRLQIYADRVPPDLAGRADEALLESKFLYVADGGVYENEGIDPLISLVRTLPRHQPVLLIVVDASQRMETTRVAGHKIWDPYSVVRKLYDIGTMRPLAYYGSIIGQFHDRSGIGGVMIRMEGYEETTDRFLQSIPTMFKLSARHRVALETAAVENVSRMQEPLMRAYHYLSRGRR